MIMIDLIETAEKVALAQFRIQIQDLSDENLIPEDPASQDYFLLRWLRARNLDLAKAELMLRNYVEWKQSNTFLKVAISPSFKSPAILDEKLQINYTGFDRDGRVVLYIPFGRWELRKVLESGYKEDCYKIQYHRLHELLAKIDQQRKLYGVDKFVVIGDSAELTFWKLASYETIQLILRFFKEFESYYPELLYAAYIVNTPTVFTYIFNIVKPLLSSLTLNKVQIFDYNEERWKAALADALPAESIPVEYGGTGKKVFTRH